MPLGSPLDHSAICSGSQSVSYPTQSVSLSSPTESTQTVTQSQSQTVTTVPPTISIIPGSTASQSGNFGLRPPTRLVIPGSGLSLIKKGFNTTSIPTSTQSQTVSVGVQARNSNNSNGSGTIYKTQVLTSGTQTVQQTQTHPGQQIPQLHHSQQQLNLCQPRQYQRHTTTSTSLSPSPNPKNTLLDQNGGNRTPTQQVQQQQQSTSYQQYSCSNSYIPPGQRLSQVVPKQNQNSGTISVPNQQRTNDYTVTNLNQNLNNLNSISRRESNFSQSSVPQLPQPVVSPPCADNVGSGGGGRLAQILNRNQNQGNQSQQEQGNHHDYGQQIHNVNQTRIQTHINNITGNTVTNQNSQTAQQQTKAQGRSSHQQQNNNMHTHSQPNMTIIGSTSVFDRLAAGAKSTRPQRQREREKHQQQQQNPFSQSLQYTTSLAGIFGALQNNSHRENNKNLNQGQNNMNHNRDNNHHQSNTNSHSVQQKSEFQSSVNTRQFLPPPRQVTQVAEHQHQNQPWATTSLIDIGSRVFVQNKPATVRYKGLTRFSHGVWIGIEFDQGYPCGKNDGTVNGVQYFKCSNCNGGVSPGLYGLFLREGANSVVLMGNGDDSSDTTTGIQQAQAQNHMPIGSPNVTSQPSLRPSSNSKTHHQQGQTQQTHNNQKLQSGLASGASTVPVPHPNGSQVAANQGGLGTRPLRNSGSSSRIRNSDKSLNSNNYSNQNVTVQNQQLHHIVSTPALNTITTASPDLNQQHSKTSKHNITKSQHNQCHKSITYSADSAGKDSAISNITAISKQYDHESQSLSDDINNSLNCYRDSIVGTSRLKNGNMYFADYNGESDGKQNPQSYRLTPDIENNETNLADNVGANIDSNIKIFSPNKIQNQNQGTRANESGTKTLEDTNNGNEQFVSNIQKRSQSTISSQIPSTPDLKPRSSLLTMSSSSKKTKVPALNFQKLQVANAVQPSSASPKVPGVSQPISNLVQGQNQTSHRKSNQSLKTVTTTTINVVQQQQQGSQFKLQSQKSSPQTQTKPQLLQASPKPNLPSPGQPKRRETIKDMSKLMDLRELQSKLNTNSSSRNLNQQQTGKISNQQFVQSSPESSSGLESNQQAKTSKDQCSPNLTVSSKSQQKVMSVQNQYQQQTSPKAQSSTTPRGLQYKQHVKLWSGLEDEDEKDYLSENSTVGLVQTYLKMNYPATSPRGEARESQGTKSGSPTTDSTTATAGTNNVTATPRTSSDSTNAGSNIPRQSDSSGSIIDQENNDVHSDLGFSFDLNDLTEQSVSDLTDRIKRLPDEPLPKQLVQQLVKKVEQLYKKLYQQSNGPLVRLNNLPKPGQRMVIVGDLHAQLEDLLWIFFKYGRPSKTNLYFFNGDMVDRGERGMEILILIWIHQLLLQDCVFVNRGNHEDSSMNERERAIGGGFADECRSKYGNQIYNDIQKIFNLMPLATVVSEKLFIIHGGLFRCNGVSLKHISRINSNRPIPEQPKTVADYIFFDSLWSDPNWNTQGPGSNSTSGKGISRRGSDCFCFGSDTTNRFLKENNLHMILRSHELPSNSRGFQVHHNAKLLTIFSASNYCGSSGNYGSVLLLQSGLEFEIFEHYAPSLQEILDLEEENQSATKALIDSIHSLEDLTRKEEMYRHISRRQCKQLSLENNGLSLQVSNTNSSDPWISNCSILESEVISKLKVRICERKRELLWWWGTNNSNNNNNSDSESVVNTVSTQSFLDGLRTVVGESVPWQDLIFQNQLNQKEKENQNQNQNQNNQIDHLSFLRRFRIELEGLNDDISSIRDSISIVWNAVIRSDLSLRQLFALFDHNLSGGINLKAFIGVLKCFENLTSIDGSEDYSGIKRLFRLISDMKYQDESESDSSEGVNESKPNTDTTANQTVKDQVDENINTDCSRFLYNFSILHRSLCKTQQQHRLKFLTPSDPFSESLVHIFEQADSDQDGLLSEQEFVEYFSGNTNKNLKSQLQTQNSNPNNFKPQSKETLHQFFKQADITKTGKLSYTEFLFMFAPDPVNIVSESDNNNMSNHHNSNSVSDLLYNSPYDDLAIFLYSSRRSLRRALQYFDSNSTYLVKKKELQYALQGLVIALSATNVNQGSVEKSSISLTSDSSEWQSVTSDRPKPQAHLLGRSEIEDLVRKLSKRYSEEGIESNESESKQQSQTQYINYHKLLDSFSVVDLALDFNNNSSTGNPTASNPNNDTQQLVNLGLAPKVYKRRCSTLNQNQNTNTNSYNGSNRKCQSQIRISVNKEGRISVGDTDLFEKLQQLFGTPNHNDKQVQVSLSLPPPHVSQNFQGRGSLSLLDSDKKLKVQNLTSTPLGLGSGLAGSPSLSNSVIKSIPENETVNHNGQSDSEINNGTCTRLSSRDLWDPVQDHHLS